MRHPLLFLSLVLFVDFAATNDLLSTRCEAQCMWELELRLQGRDQRNRLKHHIVEACKEDETCSSCLLPCDRDFEDAQKCVQRDCVSAADKALCEDSCRFLEDAFLHKPGSCPRRVNTSSDECVAQCRSDGDCPDAAKCCVSDCSRRCVNVRFPEDDLLLPLPSDISVQERKRKRSVIVRWSMGGMNGETASSSANLFILQWRWGLQPEPASMTEWQTISVHLLSPGRFYSFRVAAVNRHGSRGFSDSSEPFKLSKEARAPSSPRDFKVGVLELTDDAFFNQQLIWSPPLSDLPVKNYHLSWALSSKEEADAFEENMKRLVGRQEKRWTNDDEATTLVQRDRISVLLPSHNTYALLPRLAPDSVYIVEIHAIVDSSDGELHGEKALLFVRLPSLSSFASSRPLPSSSPLPFIQSTKKDESAPRMLDIQEPYFDEGVLKAAVSWLNSALCSPLRKTFRVRFRGSDDADWRHSRVRDCAILLQPLAFHTEYTVVVSADDVDPPLESQSSFRTARCERTPSSSPVPCRPGCSVKGSSAVCSWPSFVSSSSSPETAIGYRVVLSSRLSSNISMLPPHQTRLSFFDLDSSAIYELRVQPITNLGVGEPFITRFHTGPSALHFPEGEIMELPLESSSLSSSLHLLLPLLVFLLWR